MNRGFYNPTSQATISETQQQQVRIQTPRRGERPDSSIDTVTPSHISEVSLISERSPHCRDEPGWITTILVFLIISTALAIVFWILFYTE